MVLKRYSTVKNFFKLDDKKEETSFCHNNSNENLPVTRPHYITSKTCKMSRFLVYFAVVASLFVLVFEARPGSAISYQSYLCVARQNISSGLFSCREDCQLSHGAEGGACLTSPGVNRYNCICGPLTGRLPLREQQCIQPTTSYVELCEFDCRCNHGAFTGVCNYATKACICHGFNPHNEGCPATSFEHFLFLAKNIFLRRREGAGPSYLYERAPA